MSGDHTITAYLQSLESGDESAREALWDGVYEELRRMAAGMMSRESANHTLQPTALVHEAYARLLGGDKVEQRGRAYFFGAAAQAMRRILIEHARRNSYGKGAGGTSLGVLEGLSVKTERMSDDDLDALEASLDALKAHNPDVSEVVMLRFFAGLSVDETAETLGISARSVKRHWAYGRTWLYRRMTTDDG